MSTLTLPSAKHTKLVEHAATALASLIALWQAYMAWRLRTAAKIALCQLDDRTLRDIGLHRSEIDADAAIDAFMRHRMTSF
jgi:uncharacterized protein YjiS (DUF1127 family)